MKLKDIIGAGLMVILSISGIIFSFGIAITQVINSNGIMNCMIQVDYLDKTQQEAKKILGHYMASEKVEEILGNISVKSHIRQITAAFDTNNIEQVAGDVKTEMKKAVSNSLDEESSNESKEAYATVVSDAYIKNIFPVTEFSTLSEIYNTYSTKLKIILVVLAIVSLCIYIYLANGHKTYKWAIIALYNIVILNVILLIALRVLNGIVIGNERTTAIVISILSKVKINALIVTLVAFVIAIVSNYIAYFKKRKHSK